jgi:hypothetical protein
MKKDQPIQPWTCLHCNLVIPTDFCAHCGEKAPREHDLSLRGLSHQLFETLTKIDGRLLRSLRFLLLRPGSLTVAYVQGQRKPYIGPIRLFFLANVIFFAVESATGGAVFTTPLASHLHTQPWSAFAEGLVTDRLVTLKTTLEAYTPEFNRVVARNARSLIILMALSFAFPVWIAFLRRKIPFVVHAVFALHVYAFLLLMLCVADVIPGIDVLFGGAGFASEALDHVIAITLLTISAAYLYFAMRAVYAGSVALRLFRTIGLTAAMAAIALGYRFSLFLISLYGP